MQKLPLPFAAGDAVLARGDRWIVERVKAFDDCVLLQLTAEAEGSAGRRAQLLHPFDRPVVASVNRRMRVVGRKRWARSLQAEVAGLRTHGQLRAAASAAIDILAFQLEPALAVVRGLGSRLLLADEVGLGKTIQAGLVLAELRARGWCERALVVTPAALCQQWADELRTRFDIVAPIFDAAVLSRFSATLPFDVNPWAASPAIITSIDFLKQPEVLNAVASVLWDIVFFDEAHRAAPSSLRWAAANLTAQRARHVVLITATPHDGNDFAYRSLCRIGQIDSDDPLISFRRTRGSVGLARHRKVRLFSVRPGFHEREMHRLIATYARALWRAGRPDIAASRLVAMVLSKRAMSSASSLASSIERRIAGLAESDRERPPVQSSLPLLALDEEDGADVETLPHCPALEHFDEELGLLQAILTAARRAQEAESKMRALVRLLRRTAEPAVVFTEYRDTLTTIERTIGTLRRVVLLHGGLSSEERRMAVAAFNAGTADLLLATDAGSEGLNLQARCRLVVNLELPWNPIRLEQRIGRVDRLGQRQIVHVVNLFAEATPEAAVLAALHRRLNSMRSSEIEIAACIIDAADARPASVSTDDSSPRITTSVDVQDAAQQESIRLRQLKPARTSHARRRKEARALICISRLRRPPTQTEAIWFLRGRITSGSGLLIEEMLIPVHMRIPAPDRPLREFVDTLSNAFLASLTGKGSERLGLRADAISADTRAWVTRAIGRERQIASVLLSKSPLVQAGLFDHRRLIEREQDEARQRRFANEAASRTSGLELEGLAFSACRPVLEFLLLRC